MTSNTHSTTLIKHMGSILPYRLINDITAVLFSNFTSPPVTSTTSIPTTLLNVQCVGSISMSEVLAPSVLSLLLSCYALMPYTTLKGSSVGSGLAHVSYGTCGCGLCIRLAALRPEVLFAKYLNLRTTYLIHLVTLCTILIDSVRHLWYSEGLTFLLIPTIKESLNKLTYFTYKTPFIYTILLDYLTNIVYTNATHHS